MARVINRVVKVLSDDYEEIKTVPLTKSSIKNLDFELFLNLYQKDYNKFLSNIAIISNIFETEDLSDLCNDKDVIVFRNKINKYLNDILKSKSRKEFTYINDKAKNYQYYLEYRVDNMENISDFNYELLDFYYKDDLGNLILLKTFPLIPEFMKTLHDEFMFNIKHKSCETSYVLGVICDMYIERFEEAFEIDEDTEDLINEINEMRLVNNANCASQEDFSVEQYEKLNKNLVAAGYVLTSPINDTNEFNSYLYDKLLDQKNVKMIEKIHDIILTFDDNNPNYTELANKIVALLSLNGYELESVFVHNIRNVQGDEIFILFSITYFYAVYYSEEYLKIKKEIEGNQRTSE